MMVDDKDGDNNESSGVTVHDPLNVNYFCQVTMETAGDVTADAEQGANLKVGSEEIFITGDWTSGSAGVMKKGYKKLGGKDLENRISCDYKPKRLQKLNRLQKKHTGKKRDYRSDETNETEACEKPYACVFCEYSSNNPCYLKKHMKVHTGNKPYPCSICHLSFARTCHLKQHMRTHTGEKPYACDICFSRFSQTSSLNRHMSIHSGEKPHSCDVCGKVYRQKCQLARHVRTHVSDEYYTCSVCGYICNHLPSLTNHQKIHAGPS